MSLHALVEKWLRDAEYLISVDRSDKADGISACAEQLKAALAGGGEAVAVIGECAEVQWLNGGPCQLPPGARLYTRPAGAVQVTDEMTKRAEDYFYDNSPFTGPDELRGGLRGCLNAALNPGGSRE